MFKLVTQKRVIISTRESKGGEREEKERVMVKGIKEWWIPVFVSSSFVFPLLLFSLSHVFLFSICVTKSGGLTPDKIGHREQEAEERERKTRRNNKAIISSSS